jgi:hypothetical protein
MGLVEIACRAGAHSGRAEMSDGLTRKRWLAANPEKPLAYMRKYYRRHREILKAKKAAYDKANPEQTRERQRTFIANNPGYWREYWHRRKLRIAWINWTKTCAVSREGVAK